jgi:helix-turn-helix protein
MFSGRSSGEGAPTSVAVDIRGMGIQDEDKPGCGALRQTDAADDRGGRVIHLEALLADPARVVEVEPAVLPALLAQLTTAAAVVAARLSTIEPRSAEALPTPGGDRLLTAKEAAAVLNVSTDFVYKHEAAKPFHVRIGSEVRFSLVGIQRFIERHRGR